MKRFFSSRRGMIVAGAAIGLMAAVLQIQGNPRNMGLCMVCFPRDMAGAIGLHRAATVQYLRPEIMGAVLGALLAALICREWRPRGGSAPVVRFFLGVFAAIGALVFLGCPWRGLLRLAAGDWNSLVGMAGMAVGVAAGCGFLKRGYTLGRSYPFPKVAGWIFPGVMVLLLGFLLLRTSFQEGEAIFFSTSGPGSMHAPVWLSLFFGATIGVLAQRTRFCTMGAVRDALLIRDYHLLTGIVAFLVTAFVVNLCTGAVDMGWAAMPISHMSHAWNFLGMVLAGLCFALGGGCPGRQFFLSGEGDGDAAIFCCGMFVGAGLAHNWFLAAAPDKLLQDTVVVGGPGLPGQIAVVAGIVFCAMLGMTARRHAS
ncbi:MAG: YedE-related selenium metabolism membrane protein [Planctomycetes bacterium]|nr:YedE-related selenium metabolism membrane protein [Planctomycetota bacterium]